MFVLYLITVFIYGFIRPMICKKPQQLILLRFLFAGLQGFEP